MDFITVNNTIVTMRKSVIKAKIHVIRNLVKNIKSLKGKKTANPKEKQKNDRKAERLAIEMNMLKKVKKDKVAKFALTNVKNFLPEINPEKDQDRMNELLEKRVYIRLCNTSVLSKDIQQFRKKFPNWEKELPLIMKSLGMKQKKKDEKLKLKKKEERKLEKESKKNNTKSSDDADEEAEDESEVSDDENIKISDSKADNAEKVKSDEDNVDNDHNDDDDDDGDEEEDESESEEDSNDDDDVDNKEKSQPIPQPKIEKYEGESVIKQLDLNELIENDDSSDEEELVPKKNTKSSTKPSKETQEIPKDSFFLGGEDQSDESSNEASDNENGSKDFSTDFAVTKKRNDFTGKGFQRDSNSMHSNSNRGRGNGNRGRGDFNRGRGRGGDFNRGRGRDQGFNSRGRGGFDRGRGDYSSRPSRGDRFNDRGHRGGNRGNNRNQSFDQDYKKPNFNNQEVDQNIHPSWAAKRQQKINIDNGIQGKKIKFDQDFSDTPATSMPRTTSNFEKSEPKNLHPSWAAKKDTNKGIQPFQGKKKVFGDDDD